MSNNGNYTSSAEGEHSPHGLSRYALEIERPSSDELAELTRADKYRTLHQNNERMRQILLRWIDEQRLYDEITQIDQSTAFNLLFAFATPHGAECLEQAPGVVSIAPTEEVPVELQSPDAGIAESAPSRVSPSNEVPSKRQRNRKRSTSK